MMRLAVPQAEQLIEKGTNFSWGRGFEFVYRPNPWLGHFFPISGRRPETDFLPGGHLRKFLGWTCLRTSGGHSGG